MIHKKAKDVLTVNVEVTHNSISLFLIQDNGNRVVSIGTFERDDFWDEVDGLSPETQDDLARDWVLEQLTVKLDMHSKADYYRDLAMEEKVNELNERRHAAA